MKTESYLGRYFGRMIIFQEMASISESQLIDVSIPAGENEVIVGQLNLFEKRLLTLIAIKGREGSFLSLDVQMLVLILLAVIRDRFPFIDGTEPVLRKGYKICSKPADEDGIFSFDLAFFLEDDPAESRLVHDYANQYKN